MSGWLLAGAALLSFYLSGMEAAVTALSRLRLRRWLREGRSGARTLLRYLDRPENFLWTILVGNTLANLTVIWLAVAELQVALGESPREFWALFLGCTLAVYVVCELLPKRLFRLFPNRLALGLLAPFQLVHFLLSPVVALVEAFTAALLRLAGGSAFGSRVFADREELRAFMTDGPSELHPTERAWIGRAMDLQRRTLGGLARPLERAETVRTSTPVAQLLALCHRTGHVRFPVWGEEGGARRIVGIVSAKPLLYAEPAARPATAGECLRPALFLDDKLRLDDALSRLQRSGEHLAIVVDSSRRERGLVTLGDLLGAIFGAAPP